MGRVPHTKTLHHIEVTIIGSLSEKVREVLLTAAARGPYVNVRFCHGLRGGVAVRHTLIRGPLCMVGTGVRGLRPGAGAPCDAQGSFGHRRHCCQFNCNARPRPALGWSSRPLESQVLHTNLKISAAPTGPRRDNFSGKTLLAFQYFYWNPSTGTYSH